MCVPKYSTSAVCISCGGQIKMASTRLCSKRPIWRCSKYCKMVGCDDREAEYQIMNKEVIQDIEASASKKQKANKEKREREETPDTHKISEVGNYLNSCTNVTNVTSGKKMQPCSQNLRALWKLQFKSRSRNLSKLTWICSSDCIRPVTNSTTTAQTVCGFWLLV